MTVELPPNQHLAAPGKWPLVGEKSPRLSDAPWSVGVAGLVRQPRAWTIDELRSLPQVEQVVDIHCVTRWSKLGVQFRGVGLKTILESCGPRADAQFLSFVARSARNHSTSLAIHDALHLGVLIALTCEGQPLEEAHGGPVRVVTPGRYFYKSLKWLERIEVLAEDSLGYWESEAGYHNTADPWLEQRYVAANIDPKMLRVALERRDFRGLDLRGVDLRNRDLSGLDARNALLRDAHFENNQLVNACFIGANLSNAHLKRADLRGASFSAADVEGADFSGADLRGVDFTGASLFGATFFDESPAFAIVDSSTVIPAKLLDALTPEQAEFLVENLAKQRG